MDLHIDLYKEIAHLEMQLREIFTYIFYKEYPDTPFNVLSNYLVRQLKDIPNEEEFKNRMENEFFYLVFSDYISLEKPKEISNIKDISTLLESSDSFETFKEKITKRGITNERHQDFLASLKNNLDTIEKVRNSVAHNRTISERAFGHYEVAKNKLNESFKEFWENLSQDE
ncbi:MAG: Abi family protein [Bacteroidales bacterium]|nr:Abi family protein [Bacteroidales bacterium]